MFLRSDTGPTAGDCAVLTDTAPDCHSAAALANGDWICTCVAMTPGLTASSPLSEPWSRSASVIRGAWAFLEIQKAGASPEVPLRTGAWMRLEVSVELETNQAARVWIEELPQAALSKGVTWIQLRRINLVREIAGE